MKDIIRHIISKKKEFWVKDVQKGVEKRQEEEKDKKAFIINSIMDILSYTPPEGLFAEGSSKGIAQQLKKDSEDLKQAMSRLNYYINRAGKNLSSERAGVLEKAKEELRGLYNKEAAKDTKEYFDSKEQDKIQKQFKDHKQLPKLEDPNGNDFFRQVRKKVDEYKEKKGSGVSYIKPGFKGRKIMPHSEVCMHMQIAGKPMDFELKSNGMVQLYKDEKPFSGSITSGEAGIYQDEKGYYVHKDDLKKEGKQYGSQYREKLEDSGMKLHKRLNKEEVVLEDEAGKKELWGLKDDFAGYTIEIEGKGYEFVRSV